MARKGNANYLVDLLLLFHWRKDDGCLVIYVCWTPSTLWMTAAVHTVKYHGLMDVFSNYLDWFP
jgi:hypothetical protein